jgi:cAMP-binding proteins - catabolite gene activator and regulatory subunit of cAMP-dependent protein kinases
MEKYYPILNQCPLFRNIGNIEFGHLMKCLGAQVKHYNAEDYILLAGDQINYIGIVFSGELEIMKESLAGNKHILALIGPADMFAEGIVFTARRISPVTVRVKEEADVLLIPYERMIRSCSNTCTFHLNLIQNMMIILGEKNFILNRKLELLTLKGMREKLVSYLLNTSNDRGTDMFQINLNRTDLADYLNVSRTSMCRELARMKDEGLIDFYSNSFKLLDKERLEQCLE